MYGIVNLLFMPYVESRCYGLLSTFSDMPVRDLTAAVSSSVKQFTNAIYFNEKYTNE